MGYKYEMHCHSKMVSKCGQVEPKRIVELYKNSGYSGLVITEHYNPHTFTDKHFFNPQKDIESFLSSYYELKKYEDDDFRIFLGIEVRHHLTLSDFLCFGVDPDWLKKQGNMLNWWNRKRYKKFHESGCLVVQAHPYRQGIRAYNKFIDGVEVFNGKASKVKNAKAYKWADKYNKIKISGSDFHRETGLAKGGIETEDKIVDNRQLVEILKSGKYKLIENYGD